jgi:hypothetical protein
MAAVRGALLEALLAHNNRHGLTAAIWGEEAAEAARQAVAAVTAPLPRCAAEIPPTALRLDTPLDLAYSVRSAAPERLHSPIQGGLPGLDASTLSL